METEKRDIVIVPDLPANELVRVVQGECQITYTVIDPNWDFYRNRDGSQISGRGKSFEFKLWKPKRSDTLKEAREHFAEFGFAGHVGAFLQWCRQFVSEGFYMTIPNDEACWCDKQGTRLWAPCTYFHHPNRELRRRIVSGASSFDGCNALLGFRELPE